MNCKLDVCVRKIAYNCYSFGFEAKAKGKEIGMRCGINTFKGDIRRLFMGYMKSLLRYGIVNDYRLIAYYASDVVRYLETIVEPIPEDESKVDIQKWKIPTTLVKNCSL